MINSSNQSLCDQTLGEIGTIDCKAKNALRANAPRMSATIFSQRSSNYEVGITQFKQRSSNNKVQIIPLKILPKRLPILSFWVTFSPELA
jgi:hypothetical protein